MVNYYYSLSIFMTEVWPPVIMVPPDDSHPSLDLKAANTKLDLSEDQTEVMKVRMKQLIRKRLWVRHILADGRTFRADSMSQYSCWLPVTREKESKS